MKKKSVFIQAFNILHLLVYNVVPRAEALPRIRDNERIVH